MSSSNPLVSVVIPTYNRAHYLPECLRSVQQQTYQNLEVLVVDDGSTDGTRELMAGICREDGRIKYITQPNGGVSAARNTGLRAAQGDFIALLDSDDAWLPWKIQAQLTAFAALPPEVGMIWTDMTAIGPRGEVLHSRFLKKMYGAYAALGERTLFSQSRAVTLTDGTGREVEMDVPFGDIYTPMLFGNLVHTSTTLIRRNRADAVGLFDEKLRCGEDYVFHLTTCRLGQVAFLDLPSILYRIGCEDQITTPRNQVPFARAFRQTVEREFARTSPGNSLTPREKQQILAHAELWQGSACRTAGQPVAAVQHCLRSLWHKPAQREGWLELSRNFLPTRFRRFLRRKVLGQNVGGVTTTPATPALG